MIYYDSFMKNTIAFRHSGTVNVIVKFVANMATNNKGFWEKYAGSSGWVKRKHICHNSVWHHLETYRVSQSDTCKCTFLDWLSFNVIFLKKVDKKIATVITCKISFHRIMNISYSLLPESKLSHQCKSFFVVWVCCFCKTQCCFWSGGEALFTAKRSGLPSSWLEDQGQLSLIQDWLNQGSLNQNRCKPSQFWRI